MRGVPLRARGTFLEIGAIGGWFESTTYLFERCLGWRGVLVEPTPVTFQLLLRHRPAALNLRFAVCDNGNGFVNFTDNRKAPSTNSIVSRPRDLRGATRIVPVQCGSLGDSLIRLGIRRLYFVSVDVEGAEPLVVRSLGLGVTLAVGVLMVEVRGDGSRMPLMRALLGTGLVYAGSVHA